MPTAFGPLRHDDIGAEIHRLPGLLKVGDLDDQRRAGLADRPCERARVTEGQHHRLRVVLQHTLDRADVYRPALETDAPRLAGASRNDRQLAGQPVQIPVAAAQQSQTSAVRDSRRQRTAGRSTHRRQRNWMPHREDLRERRGQHHSRHHHTSWEAHSSPHPGPSLLGK